MAGNVLSGWFLEELGKKDERREALNRNRKREITAVRYAEGQNIFESGERKIPTTGN